MNRERSLLILHLSRNEPISFSLTNLIWIEVILNLKKNYHSDFDEPDPLPTDRMLLAAYLGKKTEGHFRHSWLRRELASASCHKFAVLAIILLVACNGYLDSRPSPSLALPNTDIRCLGLLCVCGPHRSLYPSTLIQTTLHHSCAEPFAIPSRMGIICHHISVP